MKKAMKRTAKVQGLKAAKHKRQVHSVGTTSRDGSQSITIFHDKTNGGAK